MQKFVPPYDGFHFVTVKVPNKSGFSIIYLLLFLSPGGKNGSTDTLTSAHDLFYLYRNML